MARIGGKTGNFSTTDHKIDAASFRLTGSQVVDEAVSYADTIWAQHRRTGAISLGGLVGGFAKDNEPASSPNIDGMTADGSATTVFTLNTGSTYTGTFVAQSIEISHDRNRGFTPITMSVMNQSSVTEAWDETA